VAASTRERLGLSPSRYALPSQPTTTSKPSRGFVNTPLDPLTYVRNHQELVAWHEMTPMAFGDDADIAASDASQTATGYLSTTGYVSPNARACPPPPARGSVTARYCSRVHAASRITAVGRCTSRIDRREIGRSERRLDPFCLRANDVADACGALSARCRFWRVDCPRKISSDAGVGGEDSTRCRTLIP
jgi:hypothetical protein